MTDATSRGEEKPWDCTSLYFCRTFGMTEEEAQAHSLQMGHQCEERAALPPSPQPAPAESGCICSTGAVGEYEGPLRDCPVHGEPAFEEFWQGWLSWNPEPQGAKYICALNAYEHGFRAGQEAERTGKGWPTTVEELAAFFAENAELHTTNDRLLADLAAAKARGDGWKYEYECLRDRARAINPLMEYRDELEARLAAAERENEELRRLNHDKDCIGNVDCFCGRTRPIAPPKPAPRTAPEEVGGRDAPWLQDLARIEPTVEDLKAKYLRGKTETWHPGYTAVWENGGAQGSAHREKDCGFPCPRYAGKHGVCQGEYCAHDLCCTGKCGHRGSIAPDPDTGKRVVRDEEGDVSGRQG